MKVDLILNNQRKKKTEPFCIEITRNDFISLIKDVANNLNDQDYQSTADKHKYDF